MGLDELLSDDPDIHPKSVKATNEKLRNSEKCPECGTANIKRGVAFDHCLNEDCDAMMFNHPDYEVNYEKIWD